MRGILLVPSSTMNEATEEETEEETRTAFSLRLPNTLVDEIDRQARADRRSRNNWLEVYVERKLAEDRAARDLT